MAQKTYTVYGFYNGNIKRKHFTNKRRAQRFFKHAKKSHATNVWYSVRRKK